MRAMPRFARSEGWIEQSPFERASNPLISKADEVKRKRVLSLQEESALLKACLDQGRAYLHAAIMTSVDSGVRSGELFQLIWNDLDLEDRIITVRSMTTKTMQERQTGITDRVLDTLKALRVLRADEPSDM